MALIWAWCQVAISFTPNAQYSSCVRLNWTYSSSESIWNQETTSTTTSRQGVSTAAIAQNDSVGRHHLPNIYRLPHETTNPRQETTYLQDCEIKIVLNFLQLSEKLRDACMWTLTCRTLPHSWRRVLLRLGSHPTMLFSKQLPKVCTSAKQAALRGSSHSEHTNLDGKCQTCLEFSRLEKLPAPKLEPPTIPSPLSFCSPRSPLPFIKEHLNYTTNQTQNKTTTETPAYPKTCPTLGVKGGYDFMIGLLYVYIIILPLIIKLTIMRWITLHYTTKTLQEEKP